MHKNRETRSRVSSIEVHTTNNRKFIVIEILFMGTKNDDKKKYTEDEEIQQPAQPKR